MKSFIVSVAAITVVIHACLYADNQRKNMEFLLKSYEQRSRIQDDQIRDLIADLENATLKSEAYRSEGYISGVIDSINRKPEFQQIWHRGYDRGVETQMEVEKFSRENAEKSQYLIGYKKDKDKEAKELIEKANLKIVDHYKPGLYFGVNKIEKTEKDFEKKLMENKDVIRYIEPNYEYKGSEVTQAP